jgi:WD40 repeat protein
MKTMICRFWLVTMVFTLLVTGSIAMAGEPILRLETGMHTARIDQISAAPSEQLLLTVSQDKTARLWTTKNGGRQISVLRPPIGDGDEGKLYAGALSPDGKLAAVAGATGYQWDQSYCVYVFEVSSGRLLKRLPGLPEVIHSASFSSDGKYLAVGLGKRDRDEKGGGIQVWDTATWKKAWADEDYRGAVYGIAFGNSGQLYTASFDGLLRSYDPAGRQTRKVIAPGGKRPFRIAVSPGGELVAVGYEDVGHVDVLSFSKLDRVWTPDARGIEGTRPLGQVAWSTDGSRLYAASNSRNAAGQTFIRTWLDRGRGSYIDSGVARRAIGGLAALSPSEVAFASAEPSWGVLRGDGSVAFSHTTNAVEFAGATDDFRLSPDGKVVSFDAAVPQFSGSNSTIHAETVAFTLSGRQLKTGGLGLASTRPEVSGVGMRFKAKGTGSAPLLNGKDLRLEANERWRAVAIRGERLLLGTEWSLRLFDALGGQVWATDAPGAAKAVNISADGRLAVAAFADGTIRWFSLRNGTELLALFPHGDRRRWVAWTPQGYYDANVNGDRLLIWHVNRTADQEALEYPIERFSERFNKLDIVGRALEGDEPQPSPGEPIQIPRPPVLKILFPGTEPRPSINAPLLEITYQVTSSTPVSDLRVSLDGRPVEAHPQLRGEGSGITIYSIEVPIPRHNGTVTMVARNSEGESEPAIVPFNWAGEPEPDPDWIKPDLYVLAVGVSEYKDPTLKLGFAGVDAEDLATLLQAQQGVLYRNVKTIPLVDQVATHENIHRQLASLVTIARDKDVVILFIAGHGEKFGDGQYLYKPYDYDDSNKLGTGFFGNELRDLLTASQAKLIVFLDTCYSGSFDYKARGVMQPDIDGLANMLASGDRRIVVFPSSTGQQFSQEKPEWGHGAFTKALLEAFRTDAADYDRRKTVSVQKLGVYLSDRVKEITGGQQTPPQPRISPEALANERFEFAMVHP